MNPEDYEEQFVGPKQFKRKNTKKWCKGKAGREHVPVIKFNSKYGASGCGVRYRLFICSHHVVCENCGKELKFSPDVCPTTGVALNKRSW